MRPRRIAALALAWALLMCGCAAGDTLTEFDAQGYVRGVLDHTYRGTWDAVYLDQVDLTKAQAQKVYDDGLEEELDRFCHQFSIRRDYLSQSTQDKLLDFVTDVSKKASYAVKTGVPLDGDRYAVEVVVQPVDVYLQMKEDGVRVLAKKQEEKYADADPYSMSETAQERFWKRYEEEWAQSILDLGEEKLSTASNLKETPILVAVAPLDLETSSPDRLYTLSDNDFANLTALILPY